MASTTASSTLLNSANSNSASPARAQVEARAAILASLESVGSHYDSKFQGRATDIHRNAAAISTQEATVKKSAAALGKESAKFQKEVDKATNGLKGFGDLQNWAEMMERDFLVLEETLRLVEGGGEVESASGGSQWR